MYAALSIIIPFYNVEAYIAQYVFLVKWRRHLVEWNKRYIFANRKWDFKFAE